MATLKELTEKRENLLLQYSSLKYDFEEFIKCPCETVSCQDIEYQLDFVFSEIKQVNQQIKTIILSQIESLKADFINLKTLLKIEVNKDSILISELPEKRPNMFQELLTVPQIKDKLKDFDLSWSNQSNL